MSNFKPFAQAIAAHFSTMCQGTLVRTAADPLELWDRYLAAFPEGTNPIYRVRTEHDGSYDRAFIKKLGNVVSLVEGKVVSVWDALRLPAPYDTVAAELSAFVKGHSVASAFRHKEQKVGYAETTERLENNQIKTWNHFHADIPRPYFTANVDTEVGDINTTLQVFQRGLEEIRIEDIDSVLSLIDQNALYRGAEFRAAVAGFRKIANDYKKLDDDGKNLFLWSNYTSPYARFRNTVIGTLLTDLYDGVELDRAVASYEAKVAPTNYKRTTALITPGMVKEAMKTIAEAGLEPALERRFATMHDMIINNVLWASNESRNVMEKGGIGDILAAVAVPKAKKDEKHDSITIDHFMESVAPGATGMQVLFKNSQQNHLMSLTAPVNADAPGIFKWENNFGWSYNGNITDSIKERVKLAGGNINADLRVSLAWFNHDDLDLHTLCPRFGHIYFGNKAGILDVDMNAGGGHTRSPVENLAWVQPANGRYEIKVNQYARREASNIGFTLEIECNGAIQQLSYNRAVERTVNVAEFTMTSGQMTDLKIMDTDITHQGLSQVVWNIPTEKFVDVSAVLLSPNHWDGKATGNKHWFFILDQCRNDEATRGIYNEFLKPELDKHRKVFEVLGDKTKCQPTDEQLSGLGFSSTKKESVTVKVTGPKLNKTYSVEF